MKPTGIKGASKLSATAVASVFVLAGPSTVFGADSLTEALTTGTPTLDMRIRYETVDQDNALEDADSLTVRTRVGYKTETLNGFSAVISLEDVRHALGMEDYSLGATGFKAGTYSAIADPETTELDEGYLQYKSGGFTGKFGAQVITLDNHRYVGHVGWRQDRQTFDAAALKYAMDNWTMAYYYIDQRRRIFAEVADVDSKDHLINVSGMAGPGKLTVYSYMLEVDNSTTTLDTYGLRYAGKVKGDGASYPFAVEVATQTEDTAGTELDAGYFLLEGGIKTGGYWAKIGYESLGSDEGLFGFSTPLATLHKFNGLADQFLVTPDVGLNDFYISFGTKVMSSKLAITYHSFEADESTATVDDLGSEIDVVLTKKYGKHYVAGLKFASYSAGDAAAGKVDTDKLDLWVGFKL